MKISCEIVKDLLPLYHDDICSSESRSMIEEHLSECNACKKYLDSINDEFIKNDIQEEIEHEKYDALKRIKKKLFRKNVMVSVISIVCAIAVIIGAFSLVFHYQIPILYEDGLLSANMASDGVIDVTFNGENYYCSYGMTKTIEKNGVEENVVYIYYTDSIWTKYISNPFKGETYQFSIGNSIMVDSGKNGEAIESKKDITAVYYLVGDYTELIRMSNEQFLKHTKDAILIWEK